MHDIWNPWHGCHKCSPGCQHCYMYFLDRKRGVEASSSEVRRTNAMRYPLSKNRKGEYRVRSGEKLRVNMTSDTFLFEADEWRDEMWDVIRQRPDVIFWILTKRVARMKSCLPADWGDGWDNVILNVTCENQEMFDLRAPYLLEVPAKHKGFCLAPMIGPIDVRSALSTGQIEEVSIGGENYDGCRPCDIEWVKAVSKQCEEYRVNFVWYETGAKLVAGDQMFVFGSKQAQSEYAFFAGLNRIYDRPKYVLRSSVDGHVLQYDELYERQFNKYHCVACSNMASCNGCCACGNCRKTELISEHELVDLRDRFLR